MPRALSLVLATAFCSLALGSCREAPAPVVKLGLLGVFTGTLQGSSGMPARLGAQLAVDEINEAGGVRIAGVPHRLVLVEREIENRPDAAAIGARELINLEAVDVLIGPQTSALAVAAAPVAEESQVLMLAPMASNPAVTAGRRFVFRLAFLDSYQGEVLARFAYDSLGLRRAGILHDAASPYGRDIARLFDSTFTSLGGTVVGTEVYDSDGPRDVRPQLRRLFAARPDALLLPNFVTPDSAQITQARALGFTGRLLGSDSWDVRGLSPARDALGAIIVGNWDRRSDRPAAQRLLSAWETRYREPPRATGVATYDAVHVIARAMATAGTKSGVALADALRSLGRHEGAVTTYEFGGGNDPRRGAVVLELTADGLQVRAVFSEGAR